VTKDINNFWIAFDDFKKDSTVNNFGKKYIDIGSDGVKGFIPMRIINEDHLFKTVKKKTADYEKARENTLRLTDKVKQCRSTFYAFKFLYPEAKFPPVYFVVGAFNTGGTSNKDGLIIGAEKQNNIDNVPTIVAHELIHFQQTFPKHSTLLSQSIIEGSADFIGELISGGNFNKTAYDYGDLHKEALCKEFVTKLDDTTFVDWMYGTSKKDDRPNDLGYWMGYKICEQYYNKAKDKKQAIHDILNISDYKDFLNKSGYLADYMH
jgi:uncharacterized protein YjaZ